MHLVVADNGHGIPEEHLDNIFEPFFTTKGEGGTGLGLALSKKIIERHRGTIKMRSSVRPVRVEPSSKYQFPADARIQLQSNLFAPWPQTPSQLILGKQSTRALDGKKIGVA